MNPSLSDKAVCAIETLCKLGCSQVNQLIDNAKKGKGIAELSEFDHAEVELIIDELS
jgi:hypothetical protein